MNRQKPVTAGRFFGNAGKALLYVLAFFGSQMVISLLYTLAASVYYSLQGGMDLEDYGTLMQKAEELVMACSNQIALISGLLTLMVLAVFFLLRRKNPIRETGIVASPVRCAVAAAAVTPILYFAVSMILSLLPEEWTAEYAEASAHLDTGGIVAVLSTVVIAPIVEEVVFRGLVLSRLRRVMPGWLAVVLSALVFGALHGQIIWICYATVLGLIFGLMVLRTGSLWPSLVAHIVFNGLGQLLSQLPVETGGLVIMAALAAGVILCIIFHRGFRDLFFRRRQPEVS